MEAVLEICIDQSCRVFTVFLIAHIDCVLRRGISNYRTVRHPPRGPGTQGRHPMKGMKFLPEAHRDRFFTENHDALCAPCQECLTWGRRSGECDSSALQPQLQPRQLRRRTGAGDGDRTRTALSGHRILSSFQSRFQMSPSVANRMNTGIFRFLLPASKPFTTLPDQ